MNLTDKTLLQSDLWAGFDNSQTKGDDSGYKPLPWKGSKLPPFVQMAQQTPTPTTTPTTTPTPFIILTGSNTNATNAATAISDFIANNKLLVFGLGAVALWLILGSGLTASDRTITSVTRYAPRKK